MKKTPPTFTLAGIVGGSSEASAARRDVLRGIAASVVSAVPIMLMAGKLKTQRHIAKVTNAERDKLKFLAYVDIDVHHGDGVFYAYEEDPDLVFADIHEDGRYLYPGTGREDETGKGAAKGSKLNIPLKPGSGDPEFLEAWPRVEQHLARFGPEFILFQCGADGLRGDPLAHLNYTSAAHAHAAQSLLDIAMRFSAGRLMAFGGGGYGRNNLARAWSAVLDEMVARKTSASKTQTNAQ